MLNKVIDVSGYMFSGVSTANLLIKELDNHISSDLGLEFNLLRLQDGIMDLEKALVEDWSIIRANSAIRRFKKLVKKLDGTYSKFPYKLFNFHSDYYQTRFNYKFSNLSQEYIENLITTSWQSEWPYPLYDMCEFEAFIRKIKKRLWDKERAFENEFHLIDGENFYKYTKEYLIKLLSSYDGVKNDTTTLVTNNAFEPFNAKRGLKYFDNVKCIIVKRDPRDMYVTASNHCELSSKISHNNNVENFIKRFEMQERNTDKTPNKDIMFLQYEELVLDYENTKNKIFDFLEIDESLHIKKKEFFKPEESKNFIGIYKNYGNKNEIKLIEEKLQNYCLNYI
ncbi:sulfotransferase [Aliarcobacter butzleri]|uniref:sulfotransferase n=1 Tax=Aliarcobacter butzleri TaxID=28197 RepID=UPI00126A6AE2|nr:sulfotransferase [Aliarcobacter butzleri]